MPVMRQEGHIESIKYARRVVFSEQVSLTSYKLDDVFENLGVLLKFSIFLHFLIMYTYRPCSQDIQAGIYRT
jgi:hypothetical protein